MGGRILPCFGRKRVVYVGGLQDRLTLDQNFATVLFPLPMISDVTFRENN